MRVTLIQLAGFVAKWRRAGLTDEDLQALEATLEARPTAGPVMAGTGGVRKLRFAPPSRNTGKSGAMRVAFAFFPVANTVYLLSLLAKNEQENFTAEQKAAMRAAVEILTELHRKG